MLRLLLVYAVSGFVSLGYQVAWFRIFTDWFGATNLTFALVVCNFIGGLGLGALCSERFIRLLSRPFNRSPDGLQVYGGVELLVALTALLTLLAGALPADLWGTFPYHLDDGIWVKDLSYQAGQVLVAMACILIPCFFMGTTFPLLSNLFVAEPGGDRFPSALYAVNTLGACIGVLGCQFLLLPWVGHSTTFWFMAAINAALGLYFLVSGGAPQSMSQPPNEKRVAKRRAKEPNPAARGMLLTAATLSGLLAGALEGDMFKRITFAIVNNPGAAMPAISFWAVVGIFLGSTVVRLSPRLGLAHIKAAFALAIACYGLAWHFTYPIVNSLDEGLSASAGALSVSMFPTSALQLFMFAGLYVLPSFFLISLLLPWTCNRIQTNRQHLGLAYGLNTIAFCIGMVGFTLIAPRVSIFYSMKLLFVLLICGTGLLLRDGRRLEPWKPSAALAVFLAGCVVVPSGFDHDSVNPRFVPTRQPVTSMMSNGAVTTFVLDAQHEKRLFFGNLGMSSTGSGPQTYMRLMAHVPLLAQEDPKAALLICFGVGNTASAIAMHDTIEQIDVVDLNEKVFETAPVFEETHFGVHLDPRVRFIHDDGRAYLALTTARFDLITSEPPPPMAAGVYRLYSREYYSDVLAHLTPDGMMSQWLPAYQLPAEAMERAVRTFTEVFPHTLMISGIAEELLLIGGRAPLDLERIRQRFDTMPHVVEDMRRIHVDEPLDLYARIVQTDGELRGHYGDADLISDENNHLEHLYLGPDQLPEIRYDPVEVLDEVRRRWPEFADEMEPVVTHLGRLSYRVPKFPLHQVRADSAVKYSTADWEALTKEQRYIERNLEVGNTVKAVQALKQSLQLAPEQPLPLLMLATAHLNEGRPAEAIDTARKFVRLEPEDPAGYQIVGSARLAQGRGAESARELRRALKLDPDAFRALNDLAWILAAHPDPAVRDGDEAVRLAEHANQLSGGRDPAVLDTLAAAYAAAGQFDQATATARTAIKIAKEARISALLEPIRKNLALYEQGVPLSDASLAVPGVQ